MQKTIQSHIFFAKCLLAFLPEMIFFLYFHLCGWHAKFAFEMTNSHAKLVLF